MPPPRATQGPAVSIVIPVRNQGDRLELLLQSVRDNGPRTVNFETIVVDDASDDDVANICKGYGASHFRLDSPSGPAQARNEGASHARGEYLLLLDADVVYAAGVIETLVEVFAEFPKVAAVSFLNQPCASQDGAVANAGAAMAHYMSTSAIPEGHPHGEVALFSTRSGAVRKAAFDAIGGFDERYRTNAHEDYDFSKRLSRDFKCILVRAPIVYHQYPNRLSRVVRNYFLRTALFVPYYAKNRPPFDPSVTSRTEAAIRLCAAIATAAFGATALHMHPRYFWTSLAVVSSAAYLLAVFGFLRRVRQWSGKWHAVLTGLLFHYVCSLAIVLGGLWGALSLVAKGRDT